MKLTKDEYIRQHIQYENLRRANRFFLVALLVVPSVLCTAEFFSEHGLWYIGNTWIWILLLEALFVTVVLLVHKKAAEPSGYHNLFLRVMWLGYLIVSDLLAINLKNSESSQIFLWCATIFFVIFYLSSGWSARAGLFIQAVAAVGLIVFYRLSFGIVVYNVLLIIVCNLLENYAYQLCRQKTQDQWAIRIANQRSERDPMTKLLNRRGFEPRAQQIIANSRRRRRAVAILMIDIDNFKKYNDTFGHPKGDDCICQVAGQIKTLTEETHGICARLGGEEFAVLLCGISQVDALQYANRLRLMIESLKLPQAASNFYPYVTISIGMDFHDHIYTQDYETLYQTADEALYRAKQNGRNCIYMNETRVSKGVKHFWA